jgi:hypothetical protein
MAEAAYLRPATNPTIQMPMRFSGITESAERALLGSERRQIAELFEKRSMDRLEEDALPRFRLFRPRDEVSSN